MTSSTNPKPIVIIGGGVIGISTAYFLSLLQPGREIHILESSPTLFPSASARAAGFLAKDWFSSSVADLGALSFELHKKLAEQHDGAEKWGYSPSVGLSLITRQTVAELALGREVKRGEAWLFEGTSRAGAISGDGSTSGVLTSVVGVDSNIPRWLSMAAQPQVEVISQKDSTAQVNPLRLCKFLMGECIARGVQLHLSTAATRVLRSTNDGSVVGVELSTGMSLQCKQILITAGVWTPRVVKALFPNVSPDLSALNVTSMAGYSIEYRTPKYQSVKDGGEDLCHAIFTTDEEAGFSPEMFSRREGDLYLAGLNATTIPIPDLASEVVVPEESDPNIRRLMRVGEQLVSMVGVEKGECLELVKTGLCHRPVLKDGKPIVGRIRDEDLGGEGSGGSGLGGVYTCVGHGPWGIALSLGSGLVMAEILMGKATSADVSLLAPH